MENRLKERLTGAAILVALIVGLVPEMFRGQRDEVAHPASNSGDGAPVRTYTIDLSNNPKSTAPLQSTSDEAHRNDEAHRSEPSAPPQIVSSATATPPAAVAPPPAAPAPAPPTASAERSKPDTSRSDAAKMPPPKPVNDATHVAHASAAGAWSVQVGIFAKHDNAERMAREAQSKGFNVSISSADASGLFHVRTSSFQDRAAAQVLSQKMQAQGIKSAVVPSQ